MSLPLLDLSHLAHIDPGGFVPIRRRLSPQTAAHHYPPSSVPQQTYVAALYSFYPSHLLYFFVVAYQILASNLIFTILDLVCSNPLISDQQIIVANVNTSIHHYQ